MTVLERPPRAPSPPPDDHRPEPRGLLRWLTTTDHKIIGLSYIWTSFGFFLAAGLLAMLMRTELAEPGLQVVNRAEYNQLFTMHGTMMMYLFAAPFGLGLANYFVPLHIGAPDMAFPRLNALSYWLFLGGGLTVTAGFLTAGGAADIGWTGTAPCPTPCTPPAPASTCGSPASCSPGCRRWPPASTSSPPCSACAPPA